LQWNPTFVTLAPMRWALAAATLATVVSAGAAGAWSNSPPPLYDPVFLNIGFVCHWDRRCMDRQDDARKAALKYVRKKNPPVWRVQLCNRNAGRRGERVDWVGFNHCIRNQGLVPAPAPTRESRKLRTRIIPERGR
jgi:hypothetical protein